MFDKLMKNALTEDQALTIGIDEAKALLGCEEVAKGKDYTFKGPDGKFYLNKNGKRNRPFKPALMKKYAKAMLSGAWEFNGDTNIVVDSKGKLHNRNHTLSAVVYAELERLAHKRFHTEEYSGNKTPIQVKLLLVKLATTKNSVLDSIDQGQKRSLGDVIFRRGEFKGDPKEVKASSTMLATVIRGVWNRMGKAAKDFNPQTACQFLEDHPKLIDAVLKIQELDGGKGDEGKKLSSQLPLATAATFLYLGSAIRSEVQEDGTIDSISNTNWSKAVNFFKELAEGEGLKAGQPVHTLTKALSSAGKQGKFSSSQGRDEVQGLIVKALNAYFDGEKLDPKGIKIKRKKNPDSGEMENAEYPRLGGLDVEVTPPKTSIPGWTIQDTCWVYDEEGAHWYGAIQSFYSEEGEQYAEVYCKKDDTTFGVSIDALRVEKPTNEEDEAEE